MNTIFIDLGAMDGATIDQYLSGNSICPGIAKSTNKVYAFEPMGYDREWTRLRDKYPQVDFNFEKRAVSIADQEIDFRLCPTNREAHTIMQENSSPTDKTIKIQCVDFGAWLRRTVKKVDLVICKMDIEGAEYDILDCMIDDGSIKLIRYLFVEFHDWLMPDEYRERHRKIVERCPITIGHWA